MLGKDFYNELRWQYLTNTLTTDNSYLIDNYLKRINLQGFINVSTYYYVRYFECWNTG